MRKGLLVAFVLASMVDGWATGTNQAPARADAGMSRRRALVFALPFVAAGTALPSNALDMDAFVNQELAKDSKQTELSADEALCKFGQPSFERGEACARAGKSTKLSKNGVDAYGKVFRGDFTRCKQFYDLDKNGKYVKKTECGLPPS